MIYLLNPLMWTKQNHFLYVRAIFSRPLKSLSVWSFYLFEAVAITLYVLVSLSLSI
jgi:hypothetical protein